MTKNDLTLLPVKRYDNILSNKTLILSDNNDKVGI
jgi:hypothetical protein